MLFIIDPCYASFSAGYCYYLSTFLRRAAVTTWGVGIVRNGLEDSGLTVHSTW